MVFYQTGSFPDGHASKIENFAEVLGHELTTRVDLIRNEPHHPHANEEYYKIELGPLTPLFKPIPAGKWKRITFFYTLGSLVNQAATINDLVVKTDEREVLWKSLRERKNGEYIGKANSKVEIADEELNNLLLKVMNLNAGVDFTGTDLELRK